MITLLLLAMFLVGLWWTAKIIFKLLFGNWYISTGNNDSELYSKQEGDSSIHFNGSSSRQNHKAKPTIYDMADDVDFEEVKE